MKDLLYNSSNNEMIITSSSYTSTIIPATVITSPTTTTTTPPPLLLKFEKDKYKGVVVDSQQLSTNVSEFVAKLKFSLGHWKLEGRRGVWLKIPSDKSVLIPASLEMGFAFHHAEKDYLMLNYWLSSEENRMPPNASHQVGVGCVVFSEENKLLVVQEKSGPYRNSKIWKLPTGLVEQGEDLHEAACREVFEETGIETEFQEMLCFRQAHDYALFGKSDLFFVCLLRAKSSVIRMQETEIADCSWINPEEYFTQQFFLDSGVFCRIHDVIRTAMKKQNNNNNNNNSIKHEHLPIGFRPGQVSLYHMIPTNASPQ